MKLKIIGLIIVFVNILWSFRLGFGNSHLVEYSVGKLYIEVIDSMNVDGSIDVRFGSLKGLIDFYESEKQVVFSDRKGIVENIFTFKEKGKDIVKVEFLNSGKVIYRKFIEIEYRGDSQIKDEVLFNTPKLFSGYFDFYILKPVEIEFSIYNVSGRKVGGFKEKKFVGYKRYILDIPSGIYFYRLKYGKREKSGKILIMKEVEK